jgi:hypothetical protein
VPAHNTPIKAGRREALLIAIVKARQWIDDLAYGRAASFAVIARREGKAGRRIRLLAPLAFVSPRIVSALLDGTAPADLTLAKLARALPYCWAEQERRVGPSGPFTSISEPVNLSRLIDEVIDTAGQLAEKNKNRLVIEAQENLSRLKPGKGSVFAVHLPVGGIA